MDSLICPLNMSFTARITQLKCLIMLIMFLLTDARLNENGENIFSDDYKEEISTNIPESDGRYIIVFEQGISIMSEDDVEIIADELGSKYAIQPESIYADALYGFSATNVTKEDAEDLKKELGVLLVEEDIIFKLDLPISDFDEDEIDSDGNSTNSYSSCANKKKPIPWGISRVGGYKDMSNSTKRAFILDSGVNPLRALDIDIFLAKNFVPGLNEWDWEDENGHGTHVAGIIGAKDFDCNIVGVAAGVTIVPIRVLDQAGNSRLSTAIKALNYVARVAKPGDVANLSVGGQSRQRSLDLAVLSAADSGLQITIAAGNSRTHALTFTPARVSHPNVYTVSAVDRIGCIGYFSNFGSPPVDFAAPGVSIVSLSKTGRRRISSGTSMAAPHVAGLLLTGGLRTNGVACRDPERKGVPIAYRRS